jgi:Lanthionine synthetase C-like protein.
MKNEKNILIDYILKNIDPTNPCLFSGVAGNIILLYQLSRVTKNKSYELQADQLLDTLFNLDKKKILNSDFASGLSGIGWSINYLLKHEFCSGNPDEILEDIDTLVFKDISQDKKIPMNLLNGLIGYLLYLICRLENVNNSNNFSINKELFKKLINEIDQIAPGNLALLTKDYKFDMLWPFPLLFFSLSKSLKLGIYNEKIVNSLKQWMMHIETALPTLHSNRLYLAISLYKLNEIIFFPEIDKHIYNLLYSIDFNKMLEECDVNSFCFNFSWMGQAFLLKEATLIFDKKVPNYAFFDEQRLRIIKKCKKKYFENILKCIQEEDKENPLMTGLFNGLSGIYFMFLSYPEYFE